jgi:hypothetical protein
MKNISRLNFVFMQYVCTYVCMYEITDTISTENESDEFSWTRQVQAESQFEVFTAVTMKNGVLWGITSCGSCKNQSFGGT